MSEENKAAKPLTSLEQHEIFSNAYEIALAHGTSVDEAVADIIKAKAGLYALGDGDLS
jgi:hypothetical protein